MLKLPLTVLLALALLAGVATASSSSLSGTYRATITGKPAPLNGKWQLEFLRHQANIPNSIGYDLSAALTYRPLFTQNVVFRLSGSMLLPGNGLRALYNTEGGAGLFGSGNYLYSVLANVVLTY